VNTELAGLGPSIVFKGGMEASARLNFQAQGGESPKPPNLWGAGAKTGELAFVGGHFNKNQDMV